MDRALDDVRLDGRYAGRFADQLSGGERQRVAIARALVAKPLLLLCDEILSALDVSVQANILALLHRLKLEHGIAMLLISHDLAVVRMLADRVGVLFRGEIMEIGAAEAVFKPPFHPYTLTLLQSVPDPRKRERKAPARPGMAETRAATIRLRVCRPMRLAAREDLRARSAAVAGGIGRRAHPLPPAGRATAGDSRKSCHRARLEKGPLQADEWPCQARP